MQRDSFEHSLFFLINAEPIHPLDSGPGAPVRPERPSPIQGSQRTVGSYARDEAAENITMDETVTSAGTVTAAETTTTDENVASANNLPRVGPRPFRETPAVIIYHARVVGGPATETAGQPDIVRHPDLCVERS